MLNYLSAEWYKLRRTKGIFLAFGLLLAMIVSIFVPVFWYEEPTTKVYAAAYQAFLFLGFFLAPIFAVRAFDDQYGRGTLKNEIVYGIPRSRIYLGKLALGALTGTGAALVVLGFYLLMCLVTGGWEADAVPYLRLCVDGTLLCLPLWLASMALAFTLQALFRSSAGAIALDYIFLLFSMPLVLVAPETPTNSFLWNFFSFWHFISPFRSLYTLFGGDWPTLASLSYSWLVGLGWIAVTTAVGLLVFERRELK